LTKNKEVEGPMCFGDQATLPINRGHNTYKNRGEKFKGEKIDWGSNFAQLEKSQKTLNHKKTLNLNPSIEEPSFSLLRKEPQLPLKKGAAAPT
jgi:hypothetical protein